MQNFVLWGHSLTDYKAMFSLNNEHLAGSILEYNSGATSFNADLNASGGNVVSMDDMFAMPLSELKDYIHVTFEAHLDNIKKIASKFHWGHYQDLDDLVKHRRQGMQRFLEDFESGKQQERYLAAEQFPLPYEDFHFDIALTSHYLFAMDDKVDNYVTSIKELSRVAKEVRIFPLVNKEAEVSPIIGPVMLALQDNNLGVEVREVTYQLQDNSNAMMRVWAQECTL